MGGLTRGGEHLVSKGVCDLPEAWSGEEGAVIGIQEPCCIQGTQGTTQQKWQPAQTKATHLE